MKRILTAGIVGLTLLFGSIAGAANARLQVLGQLEISKAAGLGRVEVRKGLAAVLQRDEGAVALVAINDPAHPKILGRYEDGITDSFDGDLVFSRDGRWLIYARQTHQFSKDGIHVLDVSEPPNPRLAFYQPQGGTLRIARYFDGTDEWIFTLDAIHGLVVNRFEPTTGALIPVHISPLPALKVGGPASAGLVVDERDPITKGPVLYASTGQTGVEIFDITDPVNPTLLGAWEEVGLAEIEVDVTASRRTIYGATEYWFNSGLAPEVIVLNATDPGAIKEKDRFSLGVPPDDAHRVQGMALEGKRLYVAHSQSGLKVFSSAGKVIEEYVLSGKRNDGSPYLEAPITFDVELSGGRVFVTDAATGILTILAERPVRGHHAAH